jgi:hypothetical protein
VVAAVLLFDGKSSEETFEMMQQEDGFPRLVELIQDSGNSSDIFVHKLLLILMYEMARIQRLGWNDLGMYALRHMAVNNQRLTSCPASINDKFVVSLFAIIESVSNDVSDPYHYPVIRVLLVLNEQYMVVAASQPPNSTNALTNRVLKAISTHASSYKTFGQKLILLLNRESETSLQLLILKLLYLVFGTPSTAEYFYTNDLHVLLEVILRNLLDLPSDPPGGESNAMSALKHTYLRVLHPLLENSQLGHSGEGYKRNEICAVLHILSGGSPGSDMHFAPADDTTLRLVERCRKVPWLQDEGAVQQKQKKPPAPPPSRNGHTKVARRSLGMSVDEGGQSALSVVEIANHTEKPGVVTPSRGLGGGGMVGG